MADVLNKAISSVPASELEESQSLKDLHQGLQLTESQLLKVLFVVCCTMLCKLICFNFLQVFSKHGLVQENPMGEKFDPNKHDALFQVGMFRTNVTTNYVPLVGKSAVFAIFTRLLPFTRLI